MINSMQTLKIHRSQEGGCYKSRTKDVNQATDIAKTNRKENKFLRSKFHQRSELIIKISALFLLRRSL